ncbi:MAG: putative membrane protein, partial [Limisphaerales bacterium]
GTLLFGAGIWLIAQIYHIDEHYPNAFLLWSVAALSLAWMIPSRMHALLALALAFLWGCFEIFDFNEAQHPANWLVAFGVIPLAIILRSNIILFFSIAIFTLLHAFSLVNIEDDLVFPVLIMLASAMLAVAYLLPNESSFRPADILRRIGLFIWIVLVFIGTFAELEIAALASLPSEPMNWLYWGLPTALAIITWAWVLATTVRQQTVNRQIEAAAVLTVMLTVLLISIGGKGWSGVEWILFNLAFLVVGGVTLSRGLTELRWTLTALGTAMLATIVFARFMDLFDSLLARSAAFVVTGIVLFLIGQLYNRRKRQLVEAEQADV